MGQRLFNPKPLPPLPHPTPATSTVTGPSYPTASREQHARNERMMPPPPHTSTPHTCDLHCDRRLVPNSVKGAAREERAHNELMQALLLGAPVRLAVAELGRVDRRVRLRRAGTRRGLQANETQAGKNVDGHDAGGQCGQAVQASGADGWNRSVVQTGSTGRRYRRAVQSAGLKAHRMGRLGGWGACEH
eukprot:361710-Chlamydomonas_euryale.AAC.2